MKPDDITKKLILQATLELILMRKAHELSFDLIAEQAKLPVSAIVELYNDVDAISLELTKSSLMEHKQKALEISSNKGVEALSELLSHDLLYFYELELDRKIVPLGMYTESFLLFSEYMDNDLPEIYIKFLAGNKNLLPSEDTDIQYYGHFIAHSLLFFNRAQLASVISCEAERTKVTEQIIASLFGRENLILSDLEQSI